MACGQRETVWQPPEPNPFGNPIIFYDLFPADTCPYTIDALRFYIDARGEYHYY